MISFKDFINSRTINEENIEKLYKDETNKPIVKAIQAFLDSEPAYKNIKYDRITSDEDQEEAISFINDKLDEFGEEPVESFEDLEKPWKHFETIKYRYETSKKDISDVDINNKLKHFATSIINLKDEIDSISLYDIDNVFKALKKEDANGDKSFDKQEFLAGIKELKNNYKNKIKRLACIFHLLYLKQDIIDSSDKKELFNKNNDAPDKGKMLELFKKIDKDGIFIKKDDKDNYILNDEYDKIQKVFEVFSNHYFEKSVLRNFSTIGKAEKFLNLSDEETEEKTEGEFKNKSKEQKETEETTRTLQKEKEETEKRISDLQGELNKIEADRKKAEEENKTPADEIMTKKRFYIFDLDKPKVGNPEELSEFFDKMTDENYEGGAFGLLNKLLKGYDSIEVKSSENDLKINETVKILKKAGFLTEENKYHKAKENSRKNLVELITREKEEIKKLTNKYEKILSDINNSYSSTTKFDATQTYSYQFVKELNNYVYKCSKSINDFQKTIRKTFFKEAENLKAKKEDKEYKTLGQQKQEDLDFERIRDIFKKTIENVTDKDNETIAKYLLINLLNKNNSSEDIITLLNSKNFSLLKDYVYSGSSGMIFALNKKDISEEKLGDYTVYIFTKSKAAIFKNPKELLRQSLGIEVSALSPNLMKKLKQELVNSLKQQSETAEQYLTKANEIKNIVESFVKKSLMTEDLTDTIANSLKKINGEADIRDNDYNNISKNIPNEQSVTGSLEDEIKSRTQKINLSKEFEPKGYGPEDVAFRQIFKGFCLLVNNKTGERYVTTQEGFDEIKNSKPKVVGKGLLAKAQSINNNNTSVETSDNADSTYGNGFGKNAKAISKKLNSTTYTYSPNSKTKIVRRTFD